MRTVRAPKTETHRYSPTRKQYRPDQKLTVLALETLCDAIPTGALVLDPNFRIIFLNREAMSLLQRWQNQGANSKLSRRKPISLPGDIAAGCERLRRGKAKDDEIDGRPCFGGRVLVRHARIQNLSAVIALERCLRDRRVAVFCVLLQDSFQENLGAGRKEPLAMLTIAERRVAKLVAEGLRNREIAAMLGKSVTTVKTQLGAAFAKLGIRTRTQLATLLRGS